MGREEGNATGYLQQIEDTAFGTVLWKEPPRKPVGEMGWEVRNATFTVGNVDYGSSPFGAFPAPHAPRKWPWQVRVIGRGGFDDARDTLAGAIGLGMPVRLVYHHDRGYERVVEGVAYKVTAPYTENAAFTYDFNVEYELNSHWTERNPVNTQRRCGELPLARSGQTSPILRSGSTFAVAITSDPFVVPNTMIDGSALGPGGIPNQPDTGPVITLTGPCGGANGFTLSNFSDRFECFLYYTKPLTAGQVLVIDAGAWSATLTQGGVTTDASANLASATTQQPYLFAISPGIANAIVLSSIGGSATTGGAISIQWRRFWL